MKLSGGKSQWKVKLSAIDLAKKRLADGDLRPHGSKERTSRSVSKDARTRSSRSPAKKSPRGKESLTELTSVTPRAGASSTEERVAAQDLQLQPSSKISKAKRGSKQKLAAAHRLSAASFSKKRGSRVGEPVQAEKPKRGSSSTETRAPPQRRASRKSFVDPRATDEAATSFFSALFSGSGSENEASKNHTKKAPPPPPLVPRRSQSESAAVVENGGPENESVAGGMAAFRKKSPKAKMLQRSLKSAMAGLGEETKEEEGTLSAAPPKAEPPKKRASLPATGTASSSSAPGATEKSPEKRRSFVLEFEDTATMVVWAG